MKIALIRRVPTKKTEYFEIIGVSRQLSVNFPTNESSKAAPAGLDPTTFRVTIHYSTTAPHSLYVKFFDSTIFSFLGKEPSRNSSCKHLWSLGFNFEESISLCWESIPVLLKRYKYKYGLSKNWWNLFFGIYSWAP
jgi:hypothetical protein